MSTTPWWQRPGWYYPIMTVGLAANIIMAVVILRLWWVFLSDVFS